jgi:hypothetical protein
MTPSADLKLLHGKDLSEHLKKKQEKEESEKRTEDCQKELLAVLDKYRCALDAIMIIGKNGNTPQVTIVALK